MHSLGHVRYTPYAHRYDGQTPDRPPFEILREAQARQETGFPFMVRDAARYLPRSAQCRYRESLWEVKAILARSETDDSRPLLLRLHHAGIRNCHLVTGGKIDNMYDVLDGINRQIG